MSLTAVLWLSLFAGCAIASIKRPAYAVSAYMLSFFLCPPFWWWGDAIAGYRWNLYAGLLLLASVFVNAPPPVSTWGKTPKRAVKIGLLMFLNFTFVHLAFASDAETSFEGWSLASKLLLLMFLTFACIKTHLDLKIVLLSILVGAAYIGYEVTINERGELNSNRLEGIGAPGASTANHFASLMVAVMPLVAPFFLAGRMWEKVFAVVAAPFIMNVVLLCNSRGAFLAAIMSAVVFLVSAPAEFRGKSIKLIVAGAIAAFMLMGDSRILDRFMTTFSAEEDRDASAQSRLEFAKAGLSMIADHPLGAGGDSFKYVHGLKYLRQTGAADEMKALHNGYLTEACSWGIQGSLLRLFLFGTVSLATFRAVRRNRGESSTDSFERLAACSFLSGLSAVMTTSLFGDHFDSEWGLWMIALMMAYLTLSGAENGASSISDSSVLQESHL
ncbi:O-antigen ligase family protein [Stieleria sp. TO1_6]|uniref:O-antigen ligase family protein n=1 Tax=Stieleria tagensis TaxID=2956795 RepID=UPI00209B5836|nr:O-antigen ligase family protein [Stieleria tagensis]MCO8122496.1 O-antigen ligase family protein [Stieleria tagensis]